MQAMLQPSEFSYLLHSLGATQVIGANNTQLFPQEAAVINALMQQGLAELKAHGWLIPDGAAFKTHTGLVLLTAVIADPELVLVLTLAEAGGGKQTITYSMAQNLIVEHIFTAEQKYLLTQLDRVELLVERVGDALGLTDKSPAQSKKVFLDSRSFEVVMQQAISGQLVDLETALTAANNGLQDVTSLAALLSSLRPTGRLEWAWFSEKQLDTREDVLFFKDTNHQTWSLTQDAASGKVVFHPLKSAWFEKWLHKNLLESTVKKLEQS
jgi:hypothetical protein